MRPAGYIVQQLSLRRKGQSPEAYTRWSQRIPGEYQRHVLQEPPDLSTPTLAQDEHCLARLKHYRSLMLLAMEARKPIFALKPADGAIGAHVQAVRECWRDFDALALRIAKRCGLEQGRE
jgi:chromosome partitioning protein